MADFEDAANQQPNLGGMITEKVIDGIKNLDMGEFLQNIVATTPENAEEEAARNQLQEILKKFTSMSSDEKEQFSSQIKTMIASKMSAKLKEKISGLEGTIGDAIMFRLYMVAAVVIFVIVLLVFFGYKLYKSLRDKEVKREEKKKAKLMKKKK